MRTKLNKTNMKSNFTFVTVFLLFLNNTVFGQQNIDLSWSIEPKLEYDKFEPFKEELAVVKKDGLYGYINYKGEEVIPLKYEYAKDFSDGLAEVKQNGKYGFIDKSGNFIGFRQYDYVYDFRGGLAKVKDGKFYGLINKRGNIIIPLKYTKIRHNGKNNKIIFNRYRDEGFINNIYDNYTHYYDFKEKFGNNYFKVKINDKYGVINQQGKIIIPIIYDGIGEFSNDFIYVSENNKRRIINIDGDVIIPESCRLSILSEEMVLTLDFNGNHILYDTKGNRIRTLEYDLTKRWLKYKFVEGRCLVSHYDYGRFKLGYIDKKGQTIIPLQYSDGKAFSEGLAAVKKDNKWGFIDKNGKTIIPFVYDKVFSFQEGKAEVVKNRKRGVINKFGNFTELVNYDYMKTYKNNMTIVKKNNVYGLVDKNEKVIIPIIYQGISMYKNLVRVKKDDKQGVRNIYNDLILPLVEGEITFRYGLILVTKMNSSNMVYDTYYYNLDGMLLRILNSGGYSSSWYKYNKDGLLIIQNEDSKFGCINRNGNKIIPLIYDNIIFENGVIKAKHDGKWGAIDKQGKVVIPFLYDELFKNGIIKAKQDNKWGTIDNQGRTIIPFIYDKLYKVNSTLLKVKIDRVWGLIDMNGVEVLPISYHTMTSSGGLIKVGKNFKYGFLDSNSVEVVPLVFYSNEIKHYQNGNIVIKKNDKWGIIRPYNKIPYSSSILWKSPDQDYHDKNNPKNISKPIQDLMLYVESDQKLDVFNFEIYINGKSIIGKGNEPLTTLKPKNGKYIYNFQPTINLSKYGNGQHTIKVKVIDGYKVLGESETMIFDYKKPSKPQEVVLRVVSVGAKSNLKYTTNDANAICPMFQSQTDLFSEIQCTTLVDDKANASEVYETLNKEATYFKSKYSDYNPLDILLVYVSSHGHYEIRGKDTIYYLQMSDFDSRKAKYTCIDLQDALEEFETVNCRKIFLIDACYSSLGAKDDMPDKATGKAFESLYEQQNGTYIISSSRGDQKSREADEIEHGTYTKALIDALQGGKADGYNSHITGHEKDGYIYMSELYEYLKNQVPNLNLEYGLPIQDPQRFTDLEDFVIYKVN